MYWMTKNMSYCMTKKRMNNMLCIHNRILADKTKFFVVFLQSFDLCTVCLCYGAMPFCYWHEYLNVKMVEGYLLTMNFIYCRTSLHIFMHFKNALVGKMYLLLTKTRMVQNDITNYSCSGVKFLQQLRRSITSIFNT